VVGHETESVNAVAEPTGPFLEKEVETVPVAVSQKDGLAAVTSKNHVVESTGEMDAWFASHGEMILLIFMLSAWKLGTNSPNSLNLEGVNSNCKCTTKSKPHDLCRRPVVETLSWSIV